MKITKQLPRYMVEDFGVVAVDEDCSWIEEDKQFAICHIVALECPLKIQDDAFFYYDMLDDIEKELKLMPNALRHALFIYQLNNKIELEYEEL